MKESFDSSLSLDLQTLFPFNLDDFQLEAIAALAAGKSVVVCAPTGSGKTLIAEYAIYRAFSRNKRLFYTTPLKALSNQKFRDFQEKFGEFKQVGLITGDILINPEADIVVMTTEIFRNMLYETPIGQVGTSLEDVETVVLDECHYISDLQRGTVWEESIIYCPPSIQLVALSATIGNPEQLTNWINQVRSSKGQKNYQPCELINSDFRPVPLRFYFSNSEGLFPLLNQKQKQINPKLQTKSRKSNSRRQRREDCPSIPQIIQQLQTKDMLPAIYIIFSRRGCEQAVKNLGQINLVSAEEASVIYLQILAFLLEGQPELYRQLLEALGELPELKTLIPNWIENPKEGGPPLMAFLNQLPHLKIQLIEFLAANSERARPEQLEPLTRGIATHHAGLLPAWKELVEQLFELGLIKVVFATATLAAGINMPARTTIISALSKRTESGHTSLTPSEFLQIAGRAGRRGKDSVGYVVTVQTPFEGAEEAAKLATAQPEALISCFTPSYGMVLNLLQKHTIEEVKDLLERSFAEYLAQLALAPSRQKIGEFTTKLAKLDIDLGELERQGITSKEIDSYQKLRERLKEEERLLEILQHQAESHRKRQIGPLLPDLKPGNIVALKGKHVNVSSPLVAVVVQKVAGSGQAPDLLCLGADNYWHLVANGDIADINPGFFLNLEQQNLSLPDLETMKLGQMRRGDALAEIASYQMLKYVLASPAAPEVIEQQRRVEWVEELLRVHPLNQQKNPAHIIKIYKERLLLWKQLSDIQKSYQNKKTNSSYYWREFLNLIAILQEFKALEGYKLTPLGEAAALVRGENELWIAIALNLPGFAELEPPELAAAISALISEPPRPDTWIDFPQSSRVLRVLGFEKVEGSQNISLRELRRQLNQAQSQYEPEKNFYGVAIPVWLENKFIGLVEQWALGLDWNELCDHTNLDEGDIVRLLRRTIDVLWQIPQIPTLSATLRQNATKAIAALKRFPV